MKILAIDYGRRFLGLALGHGPNPKSPVLPLPTLKIENRPAVFKKLRRICEEYQIDALVFGLPHHRDGREAVLALEIRQLAGDLSREFNFQNLYFVDESLTSFEAGRKVGRIKESKRRAAENSLAAQLILENFLKFSKK